MSNSFSDLNAAARQREAIAAIAREVVSQERPRDKYALVLSVDTNNDTAEVQFNGAGSSVTVPTAGLRPLPGQGARLSGTAGRYVLTGLVGSRGASIYELRTQQLSADQLLVTGSITDDLTVNGSVTVDDALVAANDITSSSGQFRGRTLRTNVGQELLLMAGEAGTAVEGSDGSGITSEYVYAIAEGGLQVVTSDNNWGAYSQNDWDARATTTLGNGFIQVNGEGTGTGNAGWLAFRDQAGANATRDMIIDLWGGIYGFGVAGNILRYISGDSHYFYEGTVLQALVRGEAVEERLRLYGNTSNNGGCWMSFYRGDNSATRSGWVGVTDNGVGLSGDLYVVNEEAQGHVILNADYGHKFQNSGTHCLNISSGDVTPTSAFNANLVTGSPAGQNIAIDTNEIMWRDNGQRRRTDYSSTITTTADNFQIRVDGHVTTESSYNLAMECTDQEFFAPGVYANSSSANSNPVYCAGSGGSLFSPLSKRASKKQIEPVTLAEARKALNIEWVFYTPIEMEDWSNRTPGAIAEQVNEDVDSRFVFFEEDGSVRGLSYDRLPILIGRLQQDHDKRIEALEAENATLRDRLDTLEARLDAAGV